MYDLLKKIEPRHLGVIAVGVFSFVAGIFATELSSFRSDQRQILNVEYQQVQQASQKLLDTLQPLSDTATGRAAPKKADIQSFRTQALTLFAAAHQVATRVPAAAPAFEEYSTALIALKTAAEQMHGPADARPFVRAYSDFVVAQKHFDDNIVKAQERMKWFPWQS
ncbi:MAG: hypothetical protein P4L72_15745 [Parvibaculum sp.]|uniref:hypothetical protein n=1 Tax=Parvibaculum sp. TaxID=2024848 RepID=UPI00284B35F4|nr:hypothetical protein [Parvibaculum sp.]MDR3500668.1 hypothetical protein [Parvibaculum sp.]